MKIIILKNNLKAGLDMVSRAVGSNSNLPIVGSVLIKTLENKVKIIATNLEIGITATVSGKVIEEGGVAVPFGIISSIVNNISSERINLEVKNNNLLINTDNYEASIQGTAESEFPIIPKIKNTSDFISVESSELGEALNKVIVAGGASDLRPEINGVFLIAESSSIKLVATDSFRLAEAKISPSKFKNHLPEGVRVIIPLKTAEIAAKASLEGSEGENMSLYFENNQILFKNETLEIISRIIEGKFPDYEAIVPKSLQTEVVVSRDEIINALKLASSFTAKIKDVKARVKDSKVLEIYSSDSSLGENKYLIPAKVSGEKAEVVFNLKYLLDGVKMEASDSVFLGLNEDNKPTLIKTPNSESYFYILMPVKSS